MNSNKTPTDEQLRIYLIQQIDLELEKPIDEQDMDYIDECNAFLKQIDGDRNLPDAARKQTELAKLRQKIAEKASQSVPRKGHWGKRTAALLCAVIPIDKQDTDYIDACQDLLNQAHGDENLSDADRNQLGQKIAEKRCASASRKKSWGKRAAALLCAVLALFVTSVLVVSAVNQISPVDVIKQWGAAVFDLPFDEDINVHGMTFIRNGDVKQYESVEELVEQEQLDILLPTWLPDQVRMEKIVWMETGVETLVAIVFNTETVQLSIRMNEDYYNTIRASDDATAMEIEGISCYLIPNMGNKQLVFTDKGLTYSISSPDIDNLTHILKGLK